MNMPRMILTLLFVLCLGLLINSNINAKNQIKEQKHYIAGLVMDLEGTKMEAAYYKKQVKEDTTQYDVRNYIEEYYPQVNNETAEYISSSIADASHQFGLPPSLLVALVEQESSFNRLAVGSSGEIGLTQIHPKWWSKKLGIENATLLYGVKTNITCGAQILKWLLEEAEGDMRRALRKYNGGNLYPAQVYQKVGRFQLHRKMKEYEKRSSLVEAYYRSVPLLDTAIADDKSNPVNGMSNGHVVVSGDTYGSLAKTYYGDVNKWRTIADANPYPERNIPIGVTLVIP